MPAYVFFPVCTILCLAAKGRLFLTLPCPQQLALKHRQNKTQRTRIVAFVCSPVLELEKPFISLATKLKKSNVAVDFVVLGDIDDDSRTKLEKFHEKVKSSDGCHLVIIPPSGALLSDQLIATPILMGEGAQPSEGLASGIGGSGGFDEFGGIDPSADPELALALRMSMEEERARQEKKAREEAEAAKKASLESVQEEDESAQPLLDKSGEPSGSGSGSGSGSKDDKKEGDKEGDKMDMS